MNIDGWDILTEIRDFFIDWILPIGIIVISCIVAWAFYILVKGML
jgi:hypothetical protein